MNDVTEQGRVQKRTRKHSSCPNLWCMTLLHCPHYNWHKINRSDNVLHLVVTPDGLNKVQQASDLGSGGLQEFPALVECLCQWVVYHRSGVRKDPTLLSASTEVEIAGTNPDSL